MPDSTNTQELVTIQVLPGSEIIPPNGKRDLDAVKQRAEAIFLAIKEAVLKKCEVVKNVNITDPTTCNTAQQLAKDLSTAVKTIETKRKEMKQPSMDEGALIDSIAKMLTVPANEAIAICKGKIKTYDDALRKREELAAVNTDTPEEALTLSESNVTKRAKWEFEITNVCAIPKEWIILDKAKIHEFMKERGKDTLNGEIINGVKFIKDSIVVLK